jgi:ATP-dependent protease HslVU (ClpYQ) peptidase subunit
VTCIVGIQNNGEVYIGGDSAGVAGMDISVRSDEKVFRTGPFIMGFTTSFRMGQLLRYAFEPPEPPERDLDRFMVTTFMDAVRDCMRDGGYMRISESQEEGGTFLVGVHGTLYAVHGDFQIGRTRDGYDSVGCGDSYALGSLYATKGADAKIRVRTALQAAAHHSAGVSAPFTILKG